MSLKESRAFAPCAATRGQRLLCAPKGEVTAFKKVLYLLDQSSQDEEPALERGPEWQLS